MYERQLFAAGLRGEMRDPLGNPRAAGSIISLTNFVNSLGIPTQGIAHNAGNNAFLSLLALQFILEPKVTKVPNLMSPEIQQAIMRNSGRGSVLMPGMAGMPMATPVMPMYPMMALPSPTTLFPPSPMSPSLSPDFRDRDRSSSRDGTPSTPSSGGQPRKVSLHFQMEESTSASTSILVFCF